MKKKIVVLLSLCVMAALMVAPVFATSASEGNLSSDLTSAFSTGFQQVASNVTQILVIIVPIALGIVGIIWVAKKAIGWFRSMSRG